MIRRTEAALLLASALVAASAAAQGVETRRAAFGPQKATALEALVPILYPGSVLVWEPDLATRAADGTLVRLNVPAVLQRPDADGFTFVFAIESGSAEDAIRTELAEFKAPSRTAITEIVTVKTNASLAITGHRRAFLPETAFITNVDQFQLPVDEAGGALPWPNVYIMYEAVYGTSEWYGAINWEGKISTDPVAFLHRLPVGVMKGRKGTDLPVADIPINIVNSDAESFTIYSHLRRGVVMRCAVPCVPDGRVLLGLWDVPPLVATTP